MNNETQELLRKVPVVVARAVMEINHNREVLRLEEGVVVPFVLPVSSELRKCVKQVRRAGGGSPTSVKSLFTDHVTKALEEKGYQLKVKYRWRKLDFTLA
ncbi:MAG: hypothetical protein Q7T74_01205 [Candidatus Saccharibacteria bacterium]|nr:hypothetical protein [Candidatus Saccharibacteria bacterium]